MRGGNNTVVCLFVKNNKTGTRGAKKYYQWANATHTINRRYNIDAESRVGFLLYWN